MRPGRCVLGTVTLCAAVLVAGREARASEVAACARASEDAQELRSAGRLREAREHLVVCVRGACPDVIRADCTGWLAEVDAAMPSVVIDARDAQGHDVVVLHVTVDGKPFTDRLDGKALAVDPGVHAFRYELPGGPVVEQELLIREGQQGRPLVVTFKSAGEGLAHRPPLVSLALAGVALVATGGYAYLGITAQQGASNLRDTCAPKCATSDVDGLRAKAVAANVLFGVAVVALAVSAIAWVTHASDAPAPLGGIALDAVPVHGGGMAALEAAF